MDKPDRELLDLFMAGSVGALANMDYCMIDPATNDGEIMTANGMDSTHDALLKIIADGVAACAIMLDELVRVRSAAS